MTSSELHTTTVISEGPTRRQLVFAAIVTVVLVIGITVATVVCVAPAFSDRPTAQAQAQTVVYLNGYPSEGVPIYKEPLAKPENIGLTLDTDTPVDMSCYQDFTDNGVTTRWFRIRVVVAGEQKRGWALAVMVHNQTLADSCLTGGL